MEEIAREFKKICRMLPVWVGGPEVSYEVRTFMDTHSYIDGVMIGEGEDTFRQLCAYYDSIYDQADNKNCSLSDINGIAYKDKESKKIIFTEPRSIMDMSKIPFCYDTIDDFF